MAGKVSKVKKKVVARQKAAPRSSMTSKRATAKAKEIISKRKSKDTSDYKVRGKKTNKAGKSIKAPAGGGKVGSKRSSSSSSSSGSSSSSSSGAGSTKPGSAAVRRELRAVTARQKAAGNTLTDIQLLRRARRNVKKNK